MLNSLISFGSSTKSHSSNNNKASTMRAFGKTTQASTEQSRANATSFSKVDDGDNRATTTTTSNDDSTVQCSSNYLDKHRLTHTHNLTHKFTHIV